MPLRKFLFDGKLPGSAAVGERSHVGRLARDAAYLEAANIAAANSGDCSSSLARLADLARLLDREFPGATFSVHFWPGFVTLFIGLDGDEVSIQFAVANLELTRLDIVYLKVMDAVDAIKARLKQRASSPAREG